MIVMHSTFNLSGDIGDNDFKNVFAAFAGHLTEQGLIIGWRVMGRQLHEGYNADVPDGDYYLMTEFADMEQAQACWDYVADDQPPVYDLHRAVRSVVIDTSFYLSTDL
jgi:hypothetical protein